MITLHVNKKKHQVDVAPDTPLLWVLRDNLSITSVKYSCGIAVCGVCTVLIDNEAVRSCSIRVEEVGESEIVTIEGLADDHPVKVAWIEKQAPQCGYCQPGMMLHATAFLNENPSPTDDEINSRMDDMLCRCGSHQRVKAAVQMASQIMKK
jgi:isoquinoline 1-oxidoreductase alpha subunit